MEEGAGTHGTAIMLSRMIFLPFLQSIESSSTTCGPLGDRKAIMVICKSLGSSTACSGRGAEESRACARGAQEGGCGRAGALRCDADGRHVSACTKGGAWRNVLDCGASNAACVDGRCVSRASTRAEPCSNPGQTSCSKDCTYKTVCTSNNVWVEVSPCPTGYICDCGACVDKATNYCRFSNNVICGKGSVNHLFPDVDDCSRLYACSKEGDPPGGAQVCTNDPNIYYQPCTAGCITTSTICDYYQNCTGNDGLDAVIPGNPTLHFICANNTMFLLKCESPTSMYDPRSGECIEVGFPYCPNVRTNVNSFSNLFTSDNCESTEGSSPTSTMNSSTIDTSTTDSSTSSPPCIVGEKWPDIDDECKYYYCYSTGELIHMQCPRNSKYSSAEKSCVISSGSCLR